MFKILFFIFIASYATNAVPIDGSKQQSYPRYVEFPDGEGGSHLVDLLEETDMQLLSDITRNPSNNLYLLYTRQNPDSAQVLMMNNANSIRFSDFNPNMPTVVIAHGWMSNQNTDMNPVIRDAFLKKSDVNVIVLDWRRLANSGYVTATSGVPLVGRGLGQFLEFLNEVTGAPYSKMHLIGFSLGAHLVGSAGRYLRSRVARITGLDPAGPLWHYNSDRLSAADRVYVEAIHTDGGLTGLGLGTAIGHADFFPNGGNSQPGCLTSICCHGRAWEFFVATVSYNHLIGRECASSLQITMNTCHGARFLLMGNEDVSKSGSGMYQVNTGRRYPF